MGDSGETVTCVGRTTGAHDDVSYDCYERAVMECLTVNGKWEPLCERHGGMYRSDPARVREFGGPTDG